MNKPIHTHTHTHTQTLRYREQNGSQRREEGKVKWIKRDNYVMIVGN